MSIEISYSNGVIDALEKVAEGMSMEQARDYVATKNKEKGQDALFRAGGGVGAGLAGYLANSSIDKNFVGPLQEAGSLDGHYGALAVIPGATAGYAASKVKNIFDSPSEMYKRNGSYTGRTYGGIAGGGIGAGIGAGLGNLIDDSGWGLGIGSLLGGVLGSGIGQDVGDYATERRNSDVVRKAKIEAAKHKKELQQRYK